MTVLLKSISPKPKLPRKRKKAAIKKQGRKWYYDTIKLFYMTMEVGINEPKCKFWVNDSITNKLETIGSFPAFIPVATRYW